MLDLALSAEPAPPSSSAPPDAIPLVPLSLARDRLRALGHAVLESKASQSSMIAQIKDKFLLAAEHDRAMYEDVLKRMKERANLHSQQQQRVIHTLRDEIERLKRDQDQNSQSYSAVGARDGADDPPPVPVQAFDAVDGEIGTADTDSVSASVAVMAPATGDQPTSPLAFSATAVEARVEPSLPFGLSADPVVRATQLRDLDALLQSWRALSADRVTLASTVSQLKVRQYELQTEKKLLLDLKSQRSQWASGSDQEKDFESRKTLLAQHGQELKMHHKELESQLSLFRERESAMQKLLVQWQVDEPTSDEDTTKRRKLWEEDERLIEKLLARDIIQQQPEPVPSPAPEQGVESAPVAEEQPSASPSHSQSQPSSQPTEQVGIVAEPTSMSVHAVRLEPQSQFQTQSHPKVAVLESQIAVLQSLVDELTAKLEAATLAAAAANSNTSTNSSNTNDQASSVELARILDERNRLQQSLASAERKIIESEQTFLGKLSQQQQQFNNSNSSRKDLDQMTAELTAKHQQIIDTLQSSHIEALSAHRTEVESERAIRMKLTEELSASVRQHELEQQSLATLTSQYSQLQSQSKQAIESAAVLETKVQSLSQSLVTEQQALKSLSVDRDALWVRYQEEQQRRKEFQFKYEDVKGKVRVYARVRPLTKAEVSHNEACILRMGRNDWTVELNETQRDLFNVITDKWREFAFDAVFHSGLDTINGTYASTNNSQANVFEECKIFAELSMQGINACVFAYGQSGTGKTYTMAGQLPCKDNNYSNEFVGLKPRTIDYVYQLAEQNRMTHSYAISCYLVEIYLNRLEDLSWKLEHHSAAKGDKPMPPELKLRIDSKNKRVHIENVTVKTFSSAREMLDFTEEAEKYRRVRKTGLNEASSRSHLVFALMIESTELKTGRTLKGKLSLVDLAGSERADKTNVDGLSKSAREAMMEEGVAINESLRMLKNVFRILGTQNASGATKSPKDKDKEIVQYRGNALTELMQDSLGGNAKTLMFVNVGPAASNISESIDSLGYADLVKNITMEKASADEDLAPVVRKLREQLAKYESKYGALEG